MFVAKHKTFPQKFCCRFNTSLCLRWAEVGLLGVLAVPTVIINNLNTPENRREMQHPEPIPVTTPSIRLDSLRKITRMKLSFEKGKKKGKKSIIKRNKECSKVNYGVRKSLRCTTRSGVGRVGGNKFSGWSRSL
jgi:hypothetical protein